MVSPRNPDFSKLIARLAQALHRRGISFMLIGGQAVLLGVVRRKGAELARLRALV